MDILVGLALTAHLGFVNDYNYVHPNVRLEFDNTIVAGTYYNSEENVSFYVAKNFKNTKGYFVDLGVVSGYDIEDAPIIPFFRAGKEFNDNYSLFVAPAVEVIDGENQIGAVVGFEFKFKVR